MLGCNIDSYTNIRGHGCSSRIFQRANKYFEVRSTLQLMICKINFIDKSIINTKTLNSPDRLIISNPVQLEEHRETNVFRMHSSALKIHKISKLIWFNAKLCHFIYAKISQRWSQKNSPPAARRKKLSREVVQVVLLLPTFRPVPPTFDTTLKKSQSLQTLKISSSIHL